MSERVSIDLENMSDQMDKFGSQAQETADSSSSAFDGFSLGGLTDSLTSGIFKFQMMTNVGQQLATGLLGPAENAEAMQEAFDNLTGSATTATNVLQQLDTFAAKTEFPTEDIDQYGAALLGVGVKANTIIPDLTAIGDNLSAVGKGTPAEMQQVVNILAKMSTQGKLTAGDLTQLGDHGINALQDIAKGSGLTTTEIQKMIANGTLPANKAISDMTKGIEANPIYSGGMAKQAGTLSGITSTLSSDWDQFMAKLVGPALPDLEAGLNKLVGLLTNPSFQKFATTLGTDIVHGFETAGKDVKTLVDDGQNLAKFFQNNQTAMDALGATLAAVGIGVLAFAATQVPALVVAFGAWAVGAGAAAVATLAATWPFIAIGAIAGAVIFGIVEAVQHWGAIMNWFGGVFGAIGSWIGTQFSRLGGWAHGLVDDIGGAFSALGGKVHDIWNGIWGDIKGAINWIIGGIDSFISGIDSIHVNVPGVGQVGFNVPLIPKLATGGFVAPGDVAIAGDAGPELVFGGTSGAHVFSAAQSAAMMAGGGSGETHVHIYLDGQEITNRVMQRAVTQILSYGPVKNWGTRG